MRVSKEQAAANREKVRCSNPHLSKTVELPENPSHYLAWPRPPKQYPQY